MLQRPRMRHRIPAQTGYGFFLNNGQYLRVVTPTGGQVADLVAFGQNDVTHWLSNGRTFDYNGTIYLTQGHVLYSNRSEPMLTIVADDVGRHDFLYAPCSREMFRIQYGIRTPHPNCLDNLTQALAMYGVRSHMIPTPFNIFMHVDVLPTGQLEIHPPKTQPGDSIIFRAETDLMVAVSACSAGVCNGGSCKPIDIEISDPESGVS